MTAGDLKTSHISRAQEAAPRFDFCLPCWCAANTLTAKEFRLFPSVIWDVIKMSWDSYIDNLIAQTKDASGAAHCDKACIIGLDGGAPWTTAGHACALKLQGDEGAKIAKCLKSKDFTAFQASGIWAEGVKYQFLREEDGKLVLGKKKDHGAITIQASKTAIVIAHTTEGCQQGNSNKGVAVIADYLESLGM